MGVKLLKGPGGSGGARAWEERLSSVLMKTGICDMLRPQVKLLHYMF